jgi:hypothetical protein
MSKYSFPEQGWYSRGSKHTLHWWDSKSWTGEEVPFGTDAEGLSTSASEMSQPKSSVNKPAVVGAAIFLGITALAAIIVPRLLRK